MNQNVKNRDAAERDKRQEGHQDTRLYDEEGRTTKPLILDQRCKAEQPDASGADVPDSDPARMSQTPVCDGVDHSHVTLHASEDMKQRLSRRREREHGLRHRQQASAPHKGAGAVKAARQGAEQLQEDHVVGEDVSVARLGRRGNGALLPPSLPAQV